MQLDIHVLLNIPHRHHRTLFIQSHDPIGEIEGVLLLADTNKNPVVNRVILHPLKDVFTGLSIVVFILFLVQTFILITTLS